MVISQEDGVSKKQLMLSATELENMLKEKERIGREINIEQSRVVGNDNYSRDMSSQAGNENWREKHIRKAIEESVSGAGCNRHHPWRHTSNSSVIGTTIASRI
ncbi:hypothetical protein WN943_006634 [Citrus x changshan-huyou]